MHIQDNVVFSTGEVLHFVVKRIEHLCQTILCKAVRLAVRLAVRIRLCTRTKQTTLLTQHNDKLKFKDLCHSCNISLHSQADQNSTSSKIKNLDRDFQNHKCTAQLLRALVT